MTKWSATGMLILLLSTPSFADDPEQIQQGAEQFDWQTCVDNNTSNCVNDCATSSDINCADKCEDIAKDKCMSENVQPPS